MTKTEQLADQYACEHYTEYSTDGGWSAESDYADIEEAYMNGAQGMLERVCKYIEEHIFDFPWYDTESELSSTDIVEEIRKVMEE